ncbi:Calcium-transporting ATPase 1, endoplasmic reticulum-type [Camellia lanceoleosa]|uniref:Calcium-transporting ATPase 1, endoplasmic reticulum-type n=1 Tax=Camellia lanceoleosa TaxID=1840588 RepID=A0ACC0HXR6_9ERIC|nr:Calcium-transporting ATPase 1, endoplasmic reticulum-type [Camellia lanceoleosa]
MRNNLNRVSGLNSSENEKRLKIHGYNELEKHDSPSIWTLILDQFNDTPVRSLLVAAIISLVLAVYNGGEGDDEFTPFVEPKVTFLTLIINTITSIWQENNAEKALRELKEIQSKNPNVIRDNHRTPDLPAKELVHGDIVELKVGDKERF